MRPDHTDADEAKRASKTSVERPAVLLPEKVWFLHNADFATLGVSVSRLRAGFIEK